jgi:hypothetical protein
MLGGELVTTATDARPGVRVRESVLVYSAAKTYSTPGDNTFSLNTRVDEDRGVRKLAPTMSTF